jgi:hypothetical protein
MKSQTLDWLVNIFSIIFAGRSWIRTSTKSDNVCAFNHMHNTIQQLCRSLFFNLKFFIKTPDTTMNQILIYYVNSIIMTRITINLWCLQKRECFPLYVTGSWFCMPILSTTRSSDIRNSCVLLIGAMQM